MVKEFCQKSSDGYCCYDAICNAIGKSFINMQQFYEKCDEYDNKYDITNQFSRTYFSIMNNNDSYDNIFNYILSKTGKYKTQYIETDSLTPSDLINCSSYIVFNDIHTWAVRRSRKNENIWVELDGNTQFIHPGKTKPFRGAILIYPINNVPIKNSVLSKTQIKKQQDKHNKSK
jgi:hypothetical protein